MAAVKDQTIQEKLLALYSLQQVDSKLDEISILKGELPIEVSDLEDELSGLQIRIKKLENTIADQERELSNHQANIKQSETLIEKYQKQLDNVKNNREFEALTKEIELQKLEIQLSQKKMKETASIKESKVEAMETIQTKLSSRQKDLETKKVELAKIIEKTEKEEAKLAKDSDKAKKDIDERLLKSYEKIRKTYRNGLAVVSINRGACGGCFNRIPPQLQIEVGMMRKIVACEHCGRVLVPDTLTDLETE